MIKAKEKIKKLLSIQIVKSFFVGAFSTGADLIVYAILNLVLPVSIRNIPCKLFGPFVYEPEIGGLATFIASTAAFTVGSVVSYIVQRKFVFEINTDVKKALIQFLLSSFVVYIFMTYTLELIAPFFASFLGEYIGPFVGRCVAQFMAFLMQYFINKYLILTNKQKEN